jgi:hypothetical protein
MRAVASFGMDPGFLSLGGGLGEDEPMLSDCGKVRSRPPFDVEDVAPTISMSASSTTILSSNLKGMPVIEI